MKYLPMLPLLALLLGGCASERLDPEDRDFYYRGWWNPEQGAQKRMQDGPKPGSEMPPPRSEPGLQ